MAKDVKTRIEERNRLSEWYNRDRNPVSRVIGKAGLWTANAWDITTAPFKNSLSIFAGATAFGAAKGATIGGLAGIVAGLYVLGFQTAALASFAVPAAVIGAVALGISYGQTKLENHWQASNRGLGDSIAESLGAVPTRAKLQKMQVGPPPEHKPAKMPAAADYGTDYGTEPDSPSFAQRENQRRAAAAAARLQPPPSPSQKGPTILR